MCIQPKTYNILTMLNSHESSKRDIEIPQAYYTFLS